MAGTEDAVSEMPCLQTKPVAAAPDLEAEAAMTAAAKTSTPQTTTAATSMITKGYEMSIMGPAVTPHLEGDNTKISLKNCDIEAQNKHGATSMVAAPGTIPLKTITSQNRDCGDDKTFLVLDKPTNESGGTSSDISETGIETIDASARKGNGQEKNEELKTWSVNPGHRPCAPVSDAAAAVSVMVPKTNI